MDIFQFSQNTITIDNKAYNIDEINTNTLEKKKQTLNMGNQPIQNEKGVYIFISTRDFPNFNINHFRSEVTGIFFQQKTPFTAEIGVPPYSGKYPKKDCIFYVGSAGRIISRLKEHWNSDKINGCTSLKLGFSSRKWIKPFLKVYVITSCVDEGQKFDYKQLEKKIRRKYESAFGK